MKYKISALFLAAVFLVFGGFTALTGCGDDGTVYKSGAVLTVQGSARIHRGDGSMPVYKGLSLRHGDTLYTEADSTVTMALDGDKYALIEPDSAVTFRLYKNETENVALIMITKGAVYMEADTAPSEGLTLGIGAADGIAFGGNSAYRVARGNVAPKPMWVQSIAGSVSVTPTDGETVTLSAGHECKIDRMSDGSSKLTVPDALTDPYSLPDQYIAIGAEGLFDTVGALIERPASGDVSLREIVVKKADGSVLPLTPGFDNGIAGYTVLTDSVATLTVTANHRRTKVEVQCHNASSVKSEGNTGKVIFSANETFHAVSILVTAEDGTQARFSVNIAPAE